MTIQREDAARALKEADEAAGRAATALNYREASPYLLLWGGVWVVGNLVTQFAPAASGWAWLLGVGLGMVGSGIFGVRAGRRRQSRSMRDGWLGSVMIAGALMLFGLSLSIVAPFDSWQQSEAFFCLAVGAAYIVMGVFIGFRIAAVGLLIMAVTVAGWLYAREQFALWMAVAGGGGLLLGGLWLRRV